MKKIKQGLAIAIVIALCFSLNQAALNALSFSIPEDVKTFSTEEQLIKEAPGGVLINFDDLGNYVYIGTHYDDVIFSAGYMTWNSTLNPYYFPQSSPNVAFTNEIDNAINFTNPVSYVSFYVSTVFDYNQVFTAHTSSDRVIDTVSIAENATHQFVEFDAPSGVIQRISTTGDPGFSDHWVMDDLFYLEYVPPNERIITFEDFDEGTIGDSYPGVEFSPGYNVWYSFGSLWYPPESGEQVAYSHEINNWFVFEMPVKKVG
ncbi:MAG: hypothetical protein ACFFDS_09325, partial [Candidatus Thorarchaeota archaeon]